MLSRFLNKNKNAFTLVETMVVIVIIATLIGISYPIYGRIILSGKTAKSIAQLRQFGSALIAYSSDNDGRYPIGQNKDHSSTNQGWPQEIAPFIELGSDTENIFVSPTNEHLIVKTEGTGLRACTYSAHPMVFPSMPSNESLMASATPGFQWGGGNDMKGHFLNRIKNAGDVIYIAEGSQNPDFEWSGSLAFGNEVKYKNANWYDKDEVWLDTLIDEGAFLDDDTEGGHIRFRNSGETAACLMGNMSVRSFAKDEVKIRNLVFLEKRGGGGGE